MLERRLTLTKKNTKKMDEVLLSEQEVWDVITFARALSSGLYGTTYLNPELVSGRMKDITLNPMTATEDMLNKALVSPKDYEKQLQQFSQSFELSSMPYKRLISYLANMLSFDITYTANVKSPEDYKTPKYRKDLETVDRMLDKFDYRKEFRIVTRELLRNDAYFGCFIDTGDDYVLQELPSEYCKITGRWGKGFLFSFNMYWFLQPGVFLDAYPPFFKKKYNEIFRDSNTIKQYIPSLPPEMRDKSSWIYWVDVPVNVGYCFKLTPELATRMPYFSPLFNDLVLQPLMRNLQKNVNMANAAKIIVGQVPLLNKEAKATVKDSIAISPDLLGKFLALVKNALGDAVKIASAPLEDMDSIDFAANNEMYGSYVRTSLAMSGINTNLIFSDTIKPNAIETQLSLNVDEQMMTALYEQFNNFMDYQINKFTRTFKFKFAFEGTDFFLNRNQRLEDAMTLFDKGIVLPQKIAAALAMKPSQLRKHMEEAAAMGFMDMLTPPTFEQQKTMLDLQNKQAEKMADKQAENQEKIVQEQAKLKPEVKPPAGEKTTGRPKKKDSELGEEGMKTRETAANIGRGGKV